MSEKIKYYLLTFIRYFGDSFFYPFFSLYLYSKDNIAESKVGILVAITPLIGLLANPLFSKICKNFKTLKTVLGIIGLLEALFVCIIVNSSNFYVLMVFTILLSIVGSSHYGLFDSLLTIFATESKMNFSKIRVWGSIAYVIGVTIAGKIVTDLGAYAMAFYICAGFFVLASILYWSVKPIYNEVKVEEKRSFKELFTNKKFLSYVIFYMLMYGMLKTNNNFYSLLLKNRGISEEIYGYNYALFVSVEVIILVLFDKINSKLNYRKLMFVAVSSIASMLFIYGSPLPAWVIIVFSMLRGVAWGTILHISNKIIVNLLGIKNTTIGTMLLELSASSLTIIGVFAGGFVIERFGYQIFYYSIASIATIAAIYYIFVVRKYICINDSINNDGEKQ